MKRLTMVFLLAASSAPSFSDSPSEFIAGGSKNILATMDTFAIKVVDDVVNGCLPHPNRLKDQVEIGLRRNGFHIAAESTPFTNDVVIYALGGAVEVGDRVVGCAVYIKMEIVYPSIVLVPWSEDSKKTWMGTSELVGSYLLRAPKSEMQESLETDTADFANALYLTISRARDYVEKENPSILKNWKKAQKK